MEFPLEMRPQVPFEVYRRFYLFGMSKKKHYIRRLVFLYGSMGLLMPALLAFNLAMGYLPELRTLCWVAIVFCLGMTALNMVLLRTVPRKVYKSPNFLPGQPFLLEFDEEGLSATASAKLTASRTRAAYSAMDGVFELRDAFYFYITPAQPFILPKKDVSGCGVEEFRSFLEGKLGKKFIRCE